MNMYKVNVSLLRIRNKPSDNSNNGIILKRDTIVQISGPPITYKGEIWVRIKTLHKPIVCGYVQNKYLIKL